MSFLPFTPLPPIRTNPTSIADSSATLDAKTIANCDQEEAALSRWLLEDNNDLRISLIIKEMIDNKDGKSSVGPIAACRLARIALSRIMVALRAREAEEAIEREAGEGGPSHES